MQATAEQIGQLGGTLLVIEPADLRNPGDAIGYLKRAVEMTQGDQPPNRLTNLAIAYYMTGDQTKALRTLNQALALFPYRASKDDDATLRQIMEATISKWYLPSKPKSRS